MQESKLEDVEYFIEATHTEMNLLWVTHVQRPDPSFKPIPWKEINIGVWRNIGTTCINFWFARLYGRLVAFYEPTSIKVDWNEVNEYINSFGKKKCKAGNFHLCIGALRRQN